MANIAPMTAYQGSKDMKRSKSKRTVAGKSKRPRVRASQTPFGGNDIA